MDSAVIFDVDGVLLDLTGAEEDAFFLAFERRYGLTGLSRDWDSYQVRNDEHIISEILSRHGLPAADRDGVIADYLAILSQGFGSGALRATVIPGANALLDDLRGSRLGIATANLLAAAQLRLDAAGLWPPVRALAFGAEGSGHKRETVARAIAETGLPRNRIVYIGDNLNDVDAGLSNGVHFVGFSMDDARRAKLTAAGARYAADNHAQTGIIIRQLLGVTSAE
ncbi:HAD family hydrolase [Aestuariivirga sp.]|jgi:phosphoglycolate phosphatase-like HAD superfamily hydrolase|uniref:HAD family hydrolase n=1 Tax=Aestuariivirga sp. TaxID=2650926 RepID=UPI003784C5E4